MVEVNFALSAPLVWKTGKVKPKLLRKSVWTQSNGSVSLSDFDRAPAVVMPWAASMRDLVYWDGLASDLKQLLSPVVFLTQALGHGLTTIVRKPFELIAERCNEVERDRDMCKRYRREASEVVDGFSDSSVESTYDPRMFLVLAPDVIVDLPKDEEELELSSVALSHLPNSRLDNVQQVVNGNYVIRKGKRTFYCHTLLSVLKARLGAMPKTDLNLRVVRRNAFKECESHGLRPRDRAIAVEFVTQMYFKYSAIEREVGFISRAYDSPEPKGWFKRAYHDFKLFFGLSKPLSSLAE